MPEPHSSFTGMGRSKNEFLNAMTENCLPLEFVPTLSAVYREAVPEKEMTADYYAFAPGKDGTRLCPCCQGTQRAIWRFRLIERRHIAEREVHFLPFRPTLRLKPSSPPITARGLNTALG